MKAPERIGTSQKLIQEIQLARLQLAKAESQRKSAKEQARLARDRRKEAKEAARRAGNKPSWPRERSPKRNRSWRKRKRSSPRP